MIDRRQLLASAGAALLWPAPVGRKSSDPIVGQPLPPWRPGMLDIHCLATGRGDATLIVAPDGAMALVDAGAVVRPDPAQVPARPDATRSPAEWIARYVKRRMAETGSTGLHAAMASHLHPDHIGGVGPETPLAPGGAYRLTGLAQVASLVPVAKLLDPDWPDYGHPPFEDRVSAENYIAFARAFAAAGGRIEALRVGATGQLLPDRGGLTVRTVASRGRVWTGQGVRRLFSPTPDQAGEAPSENAAASALLIRYGRFRFFHGSDLTDWADAGTRPRLNALTPAARAVGPVTVATLPHHGMFDGASAATLKALAARDWIISAWHAAHPSGETLERVLNPHLYPGPRRVWATAFHAATDLTMHRLAVRLASRTGHVVCRVRTGGDRYRVLVTTNEDESDRVMLAGPILAT